MMSSNMTAPENSRIFQVTYSDGAVIVLHAGYACFVASGEATVECGERNSPGSTFEVDRLPTGDYFRMGIVVEGKSCDDGTPHRLLYRSRKQTVIRYLSLEGVGATLSQPQMEQQVAHEAVVFARVYQPIFNREKMLAKQGRLITDLKKQVAALEEQADTADVASREHVVLILARLREGGAFGRRPPLEFLERVAKIANKQLAREGLSVARITGEEIRDAVTPESIAAEAVEEVVARFNADDDGEGLDQELEEAFAVSVREPAKVLSDSSPDSPKPPSAPRTERSTGGTPWSGIRGSSLVAPSTTGVPT